VDQDFDGAFPIVTPTYLVMRYDELPTDNCTRRKLLLTFANWLMTSQPAQNFVQELGFVRLSPGILGPVLSQFQQIKCKGEFIFAPIISNQNRQTPPLIVFAILLSLGCVASILAGIFGLVRDMKSAFIFRVYTVLFSLATFTVFTSVIPWLIIPNTTAVCLARVWMSFMSITLLLSATFAKTQIYRYVYSLDKKGDIHTLKKMTDGTHKVKAVLPLFSIIGISVAIQFVILIVWSFVQTYQSYFILTDDLLNIGEYRCTSGSNAYWIVEIIYLALLIFIGCINLYRAWGFNVQTDQSKWALISLYNFFVGGVVLIPLAVFLHTDTDISIVVSSVLVFIGTQAFICLFVPVLLEIKKNRTSRQSSTPSSNSTLQ